jgi:hypothetical protein
MSVSAFESFTAYDWEGISKKAGAFAPFVCVGLGLLTLFGTSGAFFVAMWTIVAGAAIGIVEQPQLYVMMPREEEIKNTLNETLRMKDYLPRAVAYFLLSYFMWAGPHKSYTYCVFAGIYLDINAILYVFAHINKRSDIADGIDTQSTDNETLSPSSAFGTFAA